MQLDIRLLSSVPTGVPSFIATVLLALLSSGSVAGEGPAEEEESKWDVSQPPGDWGTATIDTTTTTWSSLDISPDGATIVFDMLGDLYTMPLDGGEATALTQGIAWDMQPRYSPDGSTIVFVSDRGGADNLWLLDADGSSPRAVTEESEHLVHNPSWSPDGRWIVAKKGFTSTRSIPAGEIWIFHAGGGGGTKLAERPQGDRDQKNMAGPAFSADGRYIYFSQDSTPGLIWQYNKDSTGQIFVIQRYELETGETETFVSGPGGAVRPTPSPDGRRLAFVKRLPGLESALYIKDLESGREWDVFRGYERDHQETSGSQGNTPGFAWTPDGEELVFWTGGRFHRLDVATKTSSEIPVHVKVDLDVHPALRVPVDVAPDTVALKMLRWAQHSPDGERVLFQALGKLWIRDAESGEPRRLTGQDEHFESHPSFSPDGTRVVYASWDDQELGVVRIVSSTGGEGIAITPQPGHYVEPRFSPDGETVVYRKLSGGFLLSPLWSLEPGLWIVPTGGGEPERISNDGFDAHFGGSNDRVFFSRSVERTQLELVSVNLDGLEERSHARGARATELRVSPDGRWLAFSEGWNAWVTPFSVLGRRIDVSPSMDSQPVRQVSKRSGEFLHWSADSETLHWAHGATLYSRRLADAFSFLEGAPDELPGPVEDGLDLSFGVPADVPPGAIAITGARIVTMRDADETREILEDATIVVEGNRIVAVGDDVRVPDGAFVVDARGHTILPGLVDVHAHGSMARDEIVPEQNWQQFSNVAFGVTTVHDPSNDTSSIFAAAEMQRSGAIVSPRIFSTGTILYGAHQPGVTASVDSLDDALFHVQRLKDVGAISVKSYQQPRRDQRQQVLEAGRQLGIMVVPEGGMKFMHNMNMIVDGHTGIEHSLPLKDAYDDVLQLWSQTDVGYTPTMGVAYGGLSGEFFWYDRTDVWRNERLMRYSPRSVIEPRSMRRPKAPDDHYNHFWVAALCKKLQDRGVSVQIGAHGQREGLAAHWEMWMLEQGGFTPWEALRAATIRGAWYVGLDGALGSLEPGKLADLVVIDGNPLEDLKRSEHVVYTMLNGRLYEAATMNEIGNETHERQPFFFELEGGDTVHADAVGWQRGVAERHHWVH